MSPRLLSSFLYFHQSADQLINKDEEVYRDRLEIATYLHLNQLLWLGLDYSRREDVEYIKSYVEFLATRYININKWNGLYYPIEEAPNIFTKN